ncbi:hypothetical protein RCL1_003025 [Eukaryota sp. TZLM3-RCL]
MPLFLHDVCSKLLQALQTALLADFSVTLNDVSIFCHRAILSQQSSRIASVILKGFSEFSIDVWEEASPKELRQFIELLYGKSSTFCNQNSVSFFLLSKTLGCDEIATLSYSVLKSSNSCKYFVPVERILENLKVDEFKDHEIIFHDFSLKIHKFFFALISPYFKAKFTKQWQDSNDDSSDFSKLLQVSPSSFSSFFSSFYSGKFEVTLENAFDFSHLAWYFQLSELEKFVNDFIENSESEYNWVTSLVTKAITSEDFRFIKIISAKISEIPDLSNCDPISVHPLFFENLTSNIESFWLLKSLVFSFSNCSHENVWNANSLRKSIDTIKFDVLSIDQISQLIEPLFSTSDLFDFLSIFSLSIFTQFASEVPFSWLNWFIVESDKRQEVDLISQVSPLLNEIITPENINQVPITSFNSETLCSFAVTSSKNTSIYWSLVCLIELWSRSQLNVEEFSRILMGFDLSATKFELVYSTLAKLFSDEILRPILFEFVSLSLVARLVEEQVNTVIEQEKTITALQTQIIERDNILNCPHLQSYLKKREEDIKQQAIEAQLNQEFINKGGVKFLASNKGSHLRLSENDLLVRKTRGSIYGNWNNSFVHINHPVKGKVVLTLRNSAFDFDTRIGLFDPSHCQTSDCYNYAHALYVSNGTTQFRVNNSNTEPSNPGGISVGQQIIIDFNNDQVTFSVPSLGYSYTVTWPSGYVFGLAMLWQITSWQISSS